MTSVSYVIDDHVDPLKKCVVLSFGEALAKGDHRIIQKFAHGFAEANDVVVERIRRVSKRQLVLEILTKTRLGKTQNKNPLLG